MGLEDVFLIEETPSRKKDTISSAAASATATGDKKKKRKGSGKKT